MLLALATGAKPSSSLTAAVSRTPLSASMCAMCRPRPRPPAPPAAPLVRPLGCTIPARFVGGFGSNWGNWRPKGGGSNNNNNNNSSDGSRNDFSGTGGEPWVNPDAAVAGDTLRKYTVDLTERARNGKLDPVIGREEEVRRTLQILSRRTKSNACLIGEAGVGKTAVAEAIAQRIANDEVPDSLRGKQVLMLDVSALVAGAKFHGQFEERVQGLLKDLIALQDKVILFIDELHMVVGAGAGAEGVMSLGNMLKPALARGEIKMIGATTLMEYRRWIEKDPALNRRFKSVLVQEPTVEQTIAIMRGIKDVYELHHGVNITDSALISAAVNSHRYITDRFLPDKAIDLIDEAASRLRLQQESKPEELEDLDRRLDMLKIELEALRRESDPAMVERRKAVEDEIAKASEEAKRLEELWMREKETLSLIKEMNRRREELELKAEQARRAGDFTRASEILHGELPGIKRAMAVLVKEREEAIESQNGVLLEDRVTPRNILMVISKHTGIPVSALSQSEREKLLHLSELLHKRVVGQDEAVTAISNAVLRSRAGMARPQQPIGSFLLLGPTGVGKTAVCRALAEALTGSADYITRIDMSEYTEQHSVARLIGAPPGYVGHEEGGQLTEAVRRRPYSVVLFDEVEKAHRNVHNVLLQLLDEGRLTDSKGVVVDFTNTVIMLTSNLGAHHLMEDLSRNRHAAEGISPATRAAVMSEVHHYFAPEIINRLDEMVIFHALRPEDLKKIVRLQVAELAERLAAQDIVLTADEAACDHILHNSWDPAFGARPIRRFVIKHIGTDISRMIVSGSLAPHSSVKVTMETDRPELRYVVTKLDVPSDVPVQTSTLLS